MKDGIFNKIKHFGAELIGRERANRLSAPFYDHLARRRTARFLENLNQKDLLVNVGCGYRPLPGWVNVDIARGYADVVWDIRKGLPFNDQSCAAIFCEHVIEHLSREDGLNLLREFHRILQPGGVVRISTPDAGRFLKSYVNGDGFLNHPGFGDHVSNPLDRINMMMRENGQHLWVYDEASLIAALSLSGFKEIVRQQFAESLSGEMKAIDSPEREHESLYIEACQ